MAEWCDDEAFWAGTAGVVFSEERIAAAPKEVDQLCSLVDLPAGSAVLDMPCGVARHALELALRGHRVTGVDRTESYLEQARSSAAAAALDIEWVRADMREFRRPQTFDAALNLFTSFGYFQNPGDDRRVAENLFASLKPGGSLIMDLMSKEILARIFQPRDWRELPGGGLFLEERTVAEDWGRIKLRWMVIEADNRREYRFEHRLYSAAELKALLSAVGFVDLRVFGSLAGTPYDHQAARLVICAQRPAD